jgi:hypothetical protein
VSVVVEVVAEELRGRRLRRGGRIGERPNPLEEPAHGQGRAKDEGQEAAALVRDLDGERRPRRQRVPERVVARAARDVVKAGRLVDDEGARVVRVGARAQGGVGRRVDEDREALGDGLARHHVGEAQAERGEDRLPLHVDETRAHHPVTFP